RQPPGPGDELCAGPDRDRRVPERDAFDVVVVGNLDVEQVEVVAPVENDLAVPGRLDHDGPVRRAFAGQVVRAFEGGGRVDRGLAGVILVVIRVGAGVHEDGVARLDARTPAGRSIAGAAVVVVGAHQADERRFLARALIADRVHVIHLAAGRRLRLRTRA